MNDRSIDNGWHPLHHPAYVEWWYMDAIFQTGDVLSGSLGLWGDLRRPAGVTVRSDFFLWRPTGEVLDFGSTASLEKFKASTTQCDVCLGSHRLFEQDDGFMLLLRSPHNEATLSLQYRPLSPGFSYCYESDEPEGAFWWTAPAPSADVSGTLQKSGLSTPLSGTGYHDHNWSSISITRQFGGWDWGRLLHQASTVVFARVLTPGGSPLFQALYWADAESGEATLMTAEEHCLQIGVGGGSWRAQSRDVDFTLDLRLGKERCLAHRTSEHTYTRFLSEAQGHVGRKRHPQHLQGPLLHESQRFGKRIWVL